MEGGHEALKPVVILIDDDESLNEILTAHLREGGYDVLSFTNPSEGVKALTHPEVHVVVTDMKMKPIDGIAVLRESRSLRSEVPVILITGHATVSNAVQSMKLGAYDYITKPFSREEFLHVVGKAIEHYRLRIENRQLKQELSGRYDFRSIVGSSSAMADIFGLLEKVLDSDVAVLILGESGTGKELVARALHYNGPRGERPFVVVNCASIPDNLIESELFGHVKGAFTGALKDRKGKFQLADGGTIFLDEIGDLKPDLQTRLLRVLQEGEFERVGEGNPKKVDVRVITATNRDLETMIEEGTFREDLYYRVSVFPVHIPALRERKEDIALLSKHFLEKYTSVDPLPVISDEAADALYRYHWPGNVRELENTIERALVLSREGDITPESLPEKILQHKFGQQRPLKIPDEGIDLEELEKDLILQALNRSGGNRSKAARYLGISRPTLIYRLEKYGLTDR
jgi:two-component system NtrC family response regulator